MAKKLNSMPDYQARMPRHPHDLSQSTMFTAAPAMLLPAYYHMLHLGDKCQLQGNLSARLNPIVKPAVGSIDLHVDYFFVPLSVIYTPAPSLFYQTDDLISGMFKETDSDGESLRNDHFPILDVDAALRSVVTGSGGANRNMVFNGISYPNDSFDCAGRAAARLCDLLDFNPATLFEASTSTVKHNPNVTPWFNCAYHAIYELYEGYRNSDREKKSYIYNLDTYYTLDTGFSNAEIFALHYVEAYKDYFNSIKVSPIGSSVSMLSPATGASSDPWTVLSQVNSYLYDSVFYNRSSPSGTASTVDSNLTNVKAWSNNASTYPVGGLNSANIRQLFMVDNILRVLGRADKNYESQFLAHFGVKIPHDVLHNITHIGHDMFELNPQPTVSTADTFNGDTGSSLGEVGGNGYVRGSGKMRNFTAPCHGVFMAIFYYQPRFRYYAGVNKLHDLSSPDKFWQPEFDEKGMQPVFGYEVLKSDQDFSLLNERLGWQFAYEQFKRKYNRVSGAFAFATGQGLSGTNNYAPWVLNKTPFMKTKIGGYAEPISEESAPQIFHINDPNPLSFKSLTTDLNGIMDVAYLPTWITDLSFDNYHTLFYRDPLIVDFHMSCKISNFMSQYGEPAIGGI